MAPRGPPGKRTCHLARPFVGSPPRGAPPPFPASQPRRGPIIGVEVKESLHGGSPECVARFGDDEGASFSSPFFRLHPPTPPHATPLRRPRSPRSSPLTRVRVFGTWPRETTAPSLPGFVRVSWGQWVGVGAPRRPAVRPPPRPAPPPKASSAGCERAAAAPRSSGAGGQGERAAGRAAGSPPCSPGLRCIHSRRREERAPPPPVPRSPQPRASWW
uniref:atherin-like n=1 Tax=Jaculus jaculus TaxID=51337 RepID=UPI001E1B3A31|nr:atherin-like [Jaculus jaculus]